MGGNRKIQDSDVKGSADLTSDSRLINDTKIWLSTLSERLDQAITNGDLSSGGGGGSFVWGLDSDANAAVEDLEFSQKIFRFASGLAQTVYGVVKVPTSYKAGKPIKIKIDLYSPGTSNTILLQAVASLIRKGTDAAGSTTNQRTTTNTAITLGAPANRLNEAVLDISDSTGKINGVSVSPGDEIEVKLSRGTDTDTNDIRLRAYGAEETFQ